MTEYVDREALYNKLHEADFDCYEDHAMVENIVFLFPSADVAPVVHGRWEEKEDGWGGCYYDCSICGESWTIIDGTPFENNMSYCPKCGAKMDLEEV